MAPGGAGARARGSLLLTLATWLPCAALDNPCYGSEGWYRVCCGSRWFQERMEPFRGDLKRRYNFNATCGLKCCFIDGRTPEMCCHPPPQVLIYSMPKTATNTLWELMFDAGVVARKTHWPEQGRDHFEQMQPPCTVVTIVRNPAQRNPSQFFEFLIRNLAMLTLEFQSQRFAPLMPASYYFTQMMYTNRWVYPSEFLRESPEVVERAFKTVHRKFLGSEYFLPFFTELSSWLGVDLLSERWTAASRQQGYVFINASQEGCKCDVLLLCFEHLDKTWRQALWQAVPRARRLLPELTSLQRRKAGSGRDYAKPAKKQMLKTLNYDEDETQLMCASDTMKLPFYEGLCRGCPPENPRGCTSILPGALPLRGASSPRGTTL